MPVRQALNSAACLAGFLLAAAADAADRLILRNLDILTDRTVTALDEDGLVLDAPRPGGSQRITWDEVERGKIALNQPRFDKLLANLGPPLYRIRQRLKIGDYEAAGELAELLYPQFAERSSQTAYLVCQATMWSRLATGNREAAVEPYLRCYELLHTKAAVANSLPGSRRLSVDQQSGLATELAPVWFDPAAARAVLPGIQQTIRTLSQPRPEAAYIYYATLAIAAGDAAEADRVMPFIMATNAGGPSWRDIVKAEQELASESPGPAIDELRGARDRLPEPLRPVALLLLGLADVRSQEEEACRDGLLALLSLPAVYGDQQPELAAAGLYHAASALDKLKDTAGATAVRRELASRYAGTHFGLQGREK